MQLLKLVAKIDLHPQVLGGQRGGAQARAGADQAWGPMLVGLIVVEYDQHYKEPMID